MKTCILLLVTLSSVSAFFGGGSSKSAAPTVNKELEDAAIGIFDKKFPFGRPPAKSNPLVGLGMPNRDIDGTVLFKYDSKDAVAGKRFTDIEETTARSAFRELCKLYGSDEALQMVTVEPIVLALNYKDWGASLDAWTELFGLEESQGMVQRNPGLLAVSSKNAATTTDQAIVFSYLVAATRPFSKVLLPLLLFCLLTPLLEDVTGVAIRSAIFSQ